MLEAGGRKVFLGGNIGTPLLHLVESGEKVDFVVAELSSFQLELVAPFVPMAAVFTPIAQDHLDRYDSMSDYVAAKRRLAEFCETRSTIIFSRENPWHAQIVAGVRGTLFPYSKIPEALPSGGAIYYRSEKKIVCGDQVFDMSRCPAGDKNIENIMAAASTAGVAGISRDAIQTVIDGFQGIAHRLEWVRQCKGVTFFNDSKATNVISVLNALDQFEDQSVVLLVGGKNKSIDFSPLSESVKRKCKLVVAFGEARVALASTLEAVVPVLQADSFRDAVETAASRADSGDNVVLSPACASHDMFANYEERGNLFKSLVGEL
jgi:UDP-N-acetylmuramoylalanine--D-glutamate ligase